MVNISSGYVLTALASRMMVTFFHSLIFPKCVELISHLSPKSMFYCFEKQVVFKKRNKTPWKAID